MPKPNSVVEVSWEVANKVGGIYTVVSGKAQELVEHYEEYLCIGPLFAENRNFEFREQAAPAHIRNIIHELRDVGIQCVYGKWTVRGEPCAVLIDARQAHFDLDSIKGMLYEDFGIDSLRAAGDFDEPLRWAWAVGMFIERLQSSRDEPLVVQAHEWLAGFSLLYLRHSSSKARTVFTTHATMLGRTISANTDIKLYDDLDGINPDSLARELDVQDKHTTERACAQHADVFTTVSEITGIEAHHLLGRRPDVLLFNGISTEKYPTNEEASVLHMKAREDIRDFLDYYFFSHYTFDLEQSLQFFVSGRYEYRNKGLDVLTDALGRLNEHLKEVGHKKTVVVFYFIPTTVHGIKTELLEERSTFTNMQEYLREHGSDITRKIIRNASHLDRLSSEDLLPDEMRTHIERMAANLSHEGLPPVVTHNIVNEQQDPILQGFRRAGLDNDPSDKVKVIWYPVYLTGADGLMDLTYSEAVAGCHLGIFPSYYEPWGYTPAEAAALTVPAITTDLAGFGRYVKKASSSGGVWVLERHGKSYDDVVEQLFNVLRDFCSMDKFGRNDQKLFAKQLSKKTSWKQFITRYYEAHELAFSK